MRRVITALLLVSSLLLPGASRAQTPPGDRYLCYKAALAPKQPKFVAVQKVLQDQLWTFTADVKGFRSLCNPVLTAERPAVHHVGYKTALAKARPAQKFLKSNHTVFDAFGSHALTVLMPAELRAPSAKALGAGGTPTVSTAGVDHFECYRTAPQKGAAKFVATPVAVSDQFGTLNLTLIKRTRLCAPVNQSGEDPSAPQHPGHLVCYQAKLARGTKFSPRTVSVNNTSFGPAVLAVKAVAELCVPAFKDVIPGPTPSPSPRPTGTPVVTSSPGPECGGTTGRICTFPATCESGRCVAPCGGTPCFVSTEICCSAGPGNGICCDHATQVCSATQTSCETKVCPQGSVFVPRINDCCPSASVCGIDPLDPRVPNDCCNPVLSSCETTVENPLPHCEPLSPP